VPTLSPSALLLVWEEGLHSPPAARPLALLGGLAPDRDPEELDRLSVGRRDFELLGLREAAFGGRIEAVADCPGCGELLELSFDVSELDPGPAAESGSHVLAALGFEVRFRLPATADLVAVAGEAEVADAREALLARCVLDPPLESLPKPAREAVVRRMAEVDPFANVELELACPACGEAGSVAFDIASFLWTQLDAAARRALEDVHVLASAYGWREEDVLALGPERRRAYLELAGR
jgi:hypothetical protein